MAIRGFGIQTVTGTAQPVFGTTLTAAVTPTPDMYTGNTEPRSQRSQTILPVANPYLVRKGDKVILGAAGAFVQTNMVAQDIGTVSAINIGASTITVVGLVRSHASGEFVVLSIEAARIKITANSYTLYLGEDSTVSATSPTLVEYLLPGLSFDVGQSAIGNVHGTAHLWILGTAADTFLASIVQV